MSGHQASRRDQEVPEDASEAVEADGVATIEIGAPPLTEEEVGALSARTMEELEPGQRQDVVVVLGDIRLSENFMLSEFHCCRGHCAAAHVPGAALQALRRLVTEVLQPMRNRYQRCDVHSGHRNDTHNQHVGGESNSRHKYHRFPEEPAADVSFATGTVSEWAAEARRLLGNHRGGVGTYSWGIHVDPGAARVW